MPAAIHVTPESLAGGVLAKVRTGDVIRVDAEAGVLRVDLTDEELGRRAAETVDLAEYRHGMGRELFEVFRANAAGAEQGGMTYVLPPHPRSQTQNERDRIHDHFALDVR